MNRIAPSTSTLYIANSDGTGARRLLGNESRYDYHGMKASMMLESCLTPAASFSADGEWVTFTSERNGDGNSDLYRIRANGSDLQELIATPSVEDAGVLSPDGTKLAYVSTANGYKTKIWVLDITTGVSCNLTNTDAVKGVDWSPDGYFMPSWSPGGYWIAFSSDRNTAWTGHGNGSGWEHTQELSIYAIRPNGSDFRLVAKKDGYCLGSPKWSPSGDRIAYYEMPREYTWNAHRPEDLNSTVSQIVSVDFATGQDRRQETNTSTLKIAPQYVSADNIGYLVKGPTDQTGLHYTSGNNSIIRSLRSPAWSADGQKVVYEVTGWVNRPMEKPLYSWDDEWDYKQLGNSSIVKMNPDGSDLEMVFDVYATNQSDASLVSQGLAGAFQPSWSPDGEAASNGTWYEQLTFGSLNAGFPSYSHDGMQLVYRVWGSEYGLRVMNLTDKSVRVLTNNTGVLNSTGNVYDNLRMNYTNFDICTIRPDGTDLKVLTSSGANDAHAVWNYDGRILWSSGEKGFRAEAATYDQTFQPYGQVFAMDADGSNKRILTDSLWEDSMPLYVRNEFLE
ncbi:hypothetical protein M409DRAFT_15733 [Zasmidium cellare ATCC 36951]|uniref:Dipeptidylpeptidase IV N-terminal domain-containing protein n=1 Tax=Zasmidium cellare ATCC 36951 TaxID=1080233 RepID=A0A6A6D252_ZASCE|nr:uncharacterized protein M409DRAFT_15733 [Zasmidium cellare ATCC 36951]KAF2173451.1 hypothetical protein M409DRAFT_15733 [Zasmidium cellare ATCC 36951]